MAEFGIGVNRRTLSVARNYHCKTRDVSGCRSDRGIVCAYVGSICRTLRVTFGAGTFQSSGIADHMACIWHHLPERITGDGARHDHFSVCPTARQCDTGGYHVINITGHVVADPLAFYQTTAQPGIMAGRDIGCLRNWIGVSPLKQADLFCCQCPEATFREIGI